MGCVLVRSYGRYVDYGSDVFMEIEMTKAELRRSKEQCKLARKLREVSNRLTRNLLTEDEVNHAISEVDESIYFLREARVFEVSR